MKILSFFLFLWVIFSLLDPDPDPATQINADPCGSGYGSEPLLFLLEGSGRHQNRYNTFSIEKFLMKRIHTLDLKIDPIPDRRNKTLVSIRYYIAFNFIFRCICWTNRNFKFQVAHKTLRVILLTVNKKSLILNIWSEKYRKDFKKAPVFELSNKDTTNYLKCTAQINPRHLGYFWTYTMSFGVFLNLYHVSWGIFEQVNNVPSRTDWYCTVPVYSKVLYNKPRAVPAK